MISRTLARHAADLALTKKAYDVVILDLRKLTTMTDYFVICSADSDTQVRAVTDAVEDGLLARGEHAWHSEGIGGSTWMLLDYVNVVVHVFHKETRSFYNLDKLWGDAKIEHVEDKTAAPKKKPARRPARTPKS